jgi:hypothetical protein
MQQQRRRLGQARPIEISHISESSARCSAPPVTAPRSAVVMRHECCKA